MAVPRGAPVAVLGILAAVVSPQCVDRTVNIWPFGATEWQSNLGATCAEMATIDAKVDTFLHDVSELTENYVDVMVDAMASSDYAGGVLNGAAVLTLKVLTSVRAILVVDRALTDVPGLRDL